jgi:hypothetical protein
MSILMVEYVPANRISTLPENARPHEERLPSKSFE